LNKCTKIVIAILLVYAGWLLPMAHGEIYIWLDKASIRHLSNVKPDWWTEEMDEMEPGSVIAPDAEKTNPGIFIGDRENKKFHWPKCDQIFNQAGKLAIPAHKQIWFKSFEDAIEQGYHICDHCKPSSDGDEYQPKTP